MTGSVWYSSRLVVRLLTGRDKNKQTLLVDVGDRIGDSVFIKAARTVTNEASYFNQSFSEVSLDLECIHNIYCSVELRRDSFSPVQERTHTYTGRNDKSTNFRNHSQNVLAQRVVSSPTGWKSYAQIVSVRKNTNKQHHTTITVHTYISNARWRRLILRQMASWYTCTGCHKRTAT